MSLAGIAKTNLAITEQGFYTAPSGARREVGSSLARAKASTRLYRPEDFAPLEHLRPSPVARRVEVTHEGTIEAAIRLHAEGETGVLALNYASAKNPGGGYLGGARAQEEDLCRSSALYECQLTAPDYYAANRACGTMCYTDHLIWSPDVPVFRDGRDLLEEPFLLSFLTAPAPNAGEARRHGEPDEEVRRTLYARARKVLLVAANHGHRTLILGAWGCGVFRNDPAQVADAFAVALDEPFAAGFARVVFGVWERDPSLGNYAAFAERFSA